MPDLAEDFIDWGANKFVVTPALQSLVSAGTLTLANDKTITEAADELINALIEAQGKKVGPS